jgi:hypothetical protein
MKRTSYKRPTMKVVQLKQTGMLMTSGFDGDRGNPYGDPETPEGW